MKHHAILPAAAAALLGACAMHDGPEPYDGPAMATAEMRDPAGRLLARAEADGQDALRVRVEAEGLAPGTYAVHVHQTGRCDPPGFETAGPHWNPTGRQHGSQNPLGPHHGDLPNLSVGANGSGSFEFVVPGTSLAQAMDHDGAAIVVHAGPDDYRTDPSGNSGARIACGVLR